MMRTIGVLFLVAVIECLNAIPSLAQNPVEFGDPFVLNAQGTYYMM